MEAAEEGQQPLAVLDENVRDRLDLVRVGDKHLEDVEGLKLNVAALVAQQVHHELEVVGVADVDGHHLKVGAVEQDLAKQLR